MVNRLSYPLSLLSGMVRGGLCVHRIYRLTGPDCSYRAVIPWKRKILRNSLDVNQDLRSQGAPDLWFQINYQRSPDRGFLRPVL